MPYLKLQTNKQIVEEEKIIKGLSRLISDILNKPESYVMIALESSVKMSMNASIESAAFVELKSLGLPENSTENLSQAICTYIEENLEINLDRIYINFTNVERHMWGWNKGTF